MKYLKEQGKSLGKIVLAMYVITALLLFLLAVVVKKMQFDTKGISIGITVVYVISCFLGGFLAGKMKRQKKFCAWSGIYKQVIVSNPSAA